jgi:chitin disaccharide deacetylase
VRRLIVNADDFGLTSGVNRGILRAHEQGIVTSSTLMACSKRFDEAVELARNSPGLSVGCHVVLVDGAPVLAPADLPSLINNGGAEFRQSLMSFAMVAASGRLESSQVEAEVTAQIKTLQAAGIQVSHLDSHKHTHMFPAVLKGMLRAAKNCGIRAMRNPFEPLVFATVRNWKRHFQLRMMRSFRTTFNQALAEAGVSTPSGCIGIAATGDLNVETFRKLIESLPDGTWEFVSHPGYHDADLDQVATRLRESREKELAVLVSPEIRDLIQREQIQLISYRELS